MKPKSPGTKSVPPGVIEAVVGALIPPSHRELLLGDLYEGYTSPVSYTRAALRVLPFIIFSQVRRTLNGRLLMIQAVALLGSFQLAWHIADSLRPVVGPRGAMLPPVILALAALVLSRAYTLPVDRSRMRGAADAAVASISGVVAELVVMFVAPALLLPASVLLPATVFSVILLTITAEPGRQEFDRTTGAGPCTATSGRQILAFQRRVRRFNRLEECATILFFVVLAAPVWLASEPLSGAVAGFAMAAVVFLTCRAGGPVSGRRIPLLVSWEANRAFERSQLERQRDRLRSVSSRYLEPLLASFAFLLFVSVVRHELFGAGISGLLALAGVGLLLAAARLIRKHSQLAASRLEREIVSFDRLKSYTD